MQGRERTVSLILGLSALIGLSAVSWAEPVRFNQDIRPILNEHCISCHGGVRAKGGFSLLFRKEALAKAKSGMHPIVPGKATESEMLRRLTTSDADERMPADADPLSPGEIKLIERWIEEGAAWADHWAYIPPAKQDGSVDLFVERNLQANGLKFSSEAEKSVLIRRVSLDLVGLPPTPKQVSDFVQDTSNGAYERVVDRLLASPRFGERWAAMWLDLARFADTQGYEKDNRRSIYPYRDWVIDAFNRDLPFDQFTVHQLAGDLLPDATDRERVATGFHRNTMTNTEGGTDDEEFRVAAVIDRVNTTWEVWMGTSFGCVQCHSHPYDPIRHEDYYRFMAFLNNTADHDRSDDAPFIEPLSVIQQKQKEALQIDVERLEKESAMDTEEFVSGFQSWGKGLVAMKTPSWRDIEPTTLEAQHGTQLELLKDGSVLASGPSPEVNTYTIGAELSVKAVTGFRLEALPYGALPANGPGRAENGNFVLTEFEVWADGRKVPLRTPTADFEQISSGTSSPYGKWNAIGALDDDERGEKAGWAVLPHAGKPHQFAAQTEEPLTAKSIRIVLKQNHGNKGHTLGRFKLSVTSSPGPIRVDDRHTSSLIAILNKAEPDRSNGEARTLQRAYIEESPVLRSKRLELFQKKEEIKNMKGARTLVLEELKGGKRRKTKVFERGNWMVHGDEVTGGVPEILGDVPENASRLDMAQWVVSRENPLTARVAVNRFWEQLFGVGLVETVEDFGSKGEPPVNQPLLDYLAVKFQEEQGWRVKSLLKEIVLSRTYRQRSHVTPELLEKDPDNRWLARGARFRLSAEMIRDQALEAAGLLSEKMFGPSVMPPQPAGVWQVVYNGERWVTPKGEDRYRRGLYTYWRRTSPYPSMMAFDAPSREFCTNRRIRTNTPLGALVTLNDPVYLEASQAMAERMVKEGGIQLVDRIRYGFRLLQGAPPADANVMELVKLYKGTLKHFETEQDAVAALGESRELAGLTVVANVLLNLDGTIMKE